MNNINFKSGNLVNLKENRNEIFLLMNVNSGMARCIRVNEQGSTENVFFYTELLELSSNHINSDYELRAHNLKLVTTLLKINNNKK